MVADSPYTSVSSTALEALSYKDNISHAYGLAFTKLAIDCANGNLPDALEAITVLDALDYADADDVELITFSTILYNTSIDEERIDDYAKRIIYNGFSFEEKEEFIHDAYAIKQLIESDTEKGKEYQKVMTKLDGIEDGMLTASECAEWYVKVIHSSADKYADMGKDYTYKGIRKYLTAVLDNHNKGNLEEVSRISKGMKEQMKGPATSLDDALEQVGL